MTIDPPPASSAAAPGPRPSASPPCSARRPSAARCCSSAAAIALVWANSPWGEAYEALRDTRVGPASLHLDLTLGTWAADGLLAIFFFVAGLELKREFVAGDLREPRRAALPVAAAVGGMAVPALFFVLVNLGGRDGALRGWAIPTATDIAFALAVLAVISTHLPTALRTFLLTLAVVDDLLAIMVIAIFYTDELSRRRPAAGAACRSPLFGVAGAEAASGRWWLLLPLAALAWVLMHASGVHATVAGVLLAFTVPVVRSEAAGDRTPARARRALRAPHPAAVGRGGRPGLRLLLRRGGRRRAVRARRLAGRQRRHRHRRRPGRRQGRSASRAATWLVSRFTRAQLDEDLGWPDVVGLSLLGGIGLHRVAADHRARLRGRQRPLRPRQGRHPRRHARRRPAGRGRAAAAQPAVPADRRGGERDADGDGVPDVYQRPGRAVRRQLTIPRCRAAFGRRTFVVHERGGGP